MRERDENKSGQVHIHVELNTRTIGVNYRCQPMDKYIYTLLQPAVIHDLIGPSHSPCFHDSTKFSIVSCSIFGFFHVGVLALVVSFRQYDLITCNMKVCRGVKHFSFDRGCKIPNSTGDAEGLAGGTVFVTLDIGH